MPMVKVSNGGSSPESLIMIRAQAQTKTDPTSLTVSVTSSQDFTVSIYFGKKTQMTFDAKANMSGYIYTKDGQLINISTIGSSGTVDVSNYFSMFGWHGGNRSNMYFTLS